MEMLVALAILTLVGTAFLNSLSYSNKILRVNKAYVGAMALADKYMENAKALSWANLGVQGQEPSGSLQSVADELVDGIQYKVQNKVFWFDDPKDGFGTSDQDSNPNDYKVYKITISWTLNSHNYSYSRISKIYAPF